VTCLVEDSAEVTVDHEMLVGQHVERDPARVNSIQAVLHRPGSREQKDCSSFLVNNRRMRT